MQVRSGHADSTNVGTELNLNFSPTDLKEMTFIRPDLDLEP